VEAATEVASNLRPDDLREVVEGHGIDPTDLPILMTQNLIYTDTQLHLQERPNGMSIAVLSLSFGI
jgi:hypothetical protein